MMDPKRFEDESPRVNERYKLPRKIYQYSTPRLLGGTAITYIGICLGISFFSGSYSGAVFLFGLLYGFIPAILIGPPYGYLLARILSRLRPLWVHLLGYFLGMVALSTLAFLALMSVFFNLDAYLIVTVSAAVSGAIARAVTWDYRRPAT